jgi:hypothetical protein
MASAIELLDLTRSLREHKGGASFENAKRFQN